MTKEKIGQIKSEIQKGNFQMAYDNIYDILFNLEDYMNDTYHECHYLIGKINISWFEKEGENKFANEAYTDFITANNIYLALHGENCKEYIEAIEYTKNIYRNKNTRIINNS